jgi:hypothetical protein
MLMDVSAAWQRARKACNCWSDALNLIVEVGIGSGVVGLADLAPELGPQQFGLELLLFGYVFKIFSSETVLRTTKTRSF